MPITVILQGATIGDVRVRLSPLAELCAALHTLHAPEHHTPASTDWILRCAQTMPPAVRQAVDDWSPLWATLRARFLFPLDADADRPLTDELAAIAAMSIRDFAAMNVEAIIDRDRSLPYNEVLDHSAVAELFVHHARRFSIGHAALARRLVTDPVGYRDDLLEFVSDVGEQTFAAEWAGIVPAVRQDAERRRHDLAINGIGAIAGVSDTARELQDPHRIVFDKLYDAIGRVGEDPVVLLPSVHAGPHVVIKHAGGLPLIIQYSAGDSPRTPYEEINRRLRALSDPGRVRLARALLRGRRTTVDLAHYTGMSEPQVSRHLRRLREADLVCTSREGALVFYSLNTDTISRLGPDLLTALWR